MSKKIHVIVVPEKEKWVKDVTFKSSIYISSKLGKPKLGHRNAKYIAPFWLTGEKKGVDRVYHIIGTRVADNGTTIITLGNSFAVAPLWNNMGSHRKFEYAPLSDFGFVEITDGLLTKL